MSVKANWVWLDVDSSVLRSFPTLTNNYLILITLLPQTASYTTLSASPTTLGLKARAPFSRQMAPPPALGSPTPAFTNMKASYGTVPVQQLTYAPVHEDDKDVEAVRGSALDAPAAAAALKMDAVGPTTTMHKRRWVPGWAYLAVFVLLYSANNAVLAGLMAKGYVSRERDAFKGVCFEHSFLVWT